jgi:predicted nucleic acid-binding protein
MAEFYATITRLPPPVQRSPTEVILMLQTLRERISFIELTSSEYMETVESLARLRIPGAQIYDALHMATARKVKADVIYTWNLGHFRGVAPDLVARIVEPGS